MYFKQHNHDHPHLSTAQLQKRIALLIFLNILLKNYLQYLKCSVRVDKLSNVKHIITCDTLRKVADGVRSTPYVCFKKKKKLPKKMSENCMLLWYFQT